MNVARPSKWGNPYRVEEYGREGAIQKLIGREDAAGHCLAHVEHFVGQNVDVQTAIRLAKRMIVGGSMPTPEEARAQLEREQEREHLGEPIIGDITVAPSRAVTKTVIE